MLIVQLACRHAPRVSQAQIYIRELGITPLAIIIERAGRNELLICRARSARKKIK